MIMGAILHYGGVVVRLPVTEDFLSYKSGVFERAVMLTDADTVAWHAVQLIGWISFCRGGNSRGCPQSGAAWT